MFTLRSVSVLRILRKYPDSLSGLDQNLWPLNVTSRAPDVSNNAELNEFEKARQLRLLSPLLSYIAMSEDPKYHTIASLVSQKTEKIIERAQNTLVLVENKHISILTILIHSVNPEGHWSVVGHQTVSGLKKFAQEELTFTKLQNL